MSQQSSANNQRIECPLAHSLINKLSIIIGNCDLLMEDTPEDSPILSRMKLIRDTATLMSADLAQFQCDLAQRRLANTWRAAVGL